MRTILTLLLILTYSFNVHCKQPAKSQVSEDSGSDLKVLKPQPVTSLDEKVVETSGLLYFDNYFWTINDSDNENILYKLDLKNGAVVAEFKVNNSENVDWEELTQDRDYLYIADIGDNALARAEKQIYRIRKSDLLQRSGGSVNPEVIRFTYPEKDGKSERFDAEALVSLNGSLHLFTKDLFESNHFIIPAVPGKTIAKFSDKFNSNGQVTGAALDSASNSLILVGYFGFGQRLLWEFKNIDRSAFLAKPPVAFSLGGVTETGQIEAVCFTPEKKVYLTNEQFGGLKQQLWNLTYPLQ